MGLKGSSRCRNPKSEYAVDVVTVGRQVLASVPTSAARIQLLEKARRTARLAVVLHVTVSDEGSHLARALGRLCGSTYAESFQVLRIRI